jgi:UDP-N-acetylglucosamine--N-acetylmuramyl-(pentapeptide) pyrophosphoryl-undecaprenol N-acetylglucosamine transferase
MNGRPVLILAGGTGGHIFPGLAVAAALAARDVPVAWLGSAGGLESRLVPEAGFDFHGIPVSGLRGKGALAWLVAPWRLARAIGAALGRVRALRPRAAVSFGGFAAGPGGLAARLVGVPLVVHEQNRVPGLTNRVLAHLARRVVVGFRDAFGAAHKAMHLGNPVRAAIASIEAPESRLGARGATDPIRLLVLGGSQGARALNRALPLALAAIAAGREAPTFEVRHQAGRALLDEASAAYRAAGVAAEVLPFIADMAEAYAWADLVVCRAGALTLAELCAAGVAAVLVPYPYAVDDHQTRNAEALVERGAAVLVPESPQLADALANAIGRLAASPELRLGMARAARHLAMPDAAERIAEVVLSEALA